MIIDSITVDGKKHGQNGGKASTVKLSPGEIITKITYGQASFRGEKCLTKLTFHSNTGKKYGPYGYGSSRYGEFTANVPCDWNTVIKMDKKYPTGFEKATQSSKPKKSSGGG